MYLIHFSLIISGLREFGVLCSKFLKLSTVLWLASLSYLYLFLKDTCRPMFTFSEVIRIHFRESTIGVHFWGFWYTLVDIPWSLTWFTLLPVVYKPVSQNPDQYGELSYNLKYLVKSGTSLLRYVLFFYNSNTERSFICLLTICYFSSVNYLSPFAYLFFSHCFISFLSKWSLLTL